MQMTQLVRNLGRNDVKLIGRDSFLVMMLFVVLGFAFVTRLGLPWMDNYLAENGILPNEAAPFRLVELYPMMVGYVSVYLGALLAGTIFGFMLLDEKDDKTITAMLVTPISLQKYLLYRTGIATLIGFFGVMASFLIIGQELLPLWQMAWISAVAALAAPLSALFFATFAENKVQGFALTKFVGLAGLTIIIGWFIAEPAQYLLGFFPPFWVVKSYWLALEGNNLWLGTLAIGLVMQIIGIWWMTRRFSKVAYAA